MDAGKGDVTATGSLAPMPGSFVGLNPSRLGKHTQQITASQPGIPNIDFTVIFEYANDLSVCR